MTKRVEALLREIMENGLVRHRVGTATILLYGLMTVILKHW